MKKILGISTVLLCLLGTTTQAQTNLELKKTIDSLYKIDQNVQLRIKNAIDSKVRFDSIQKLQDVERETFDRHIVIIKKIYARFGYPTIELVGQESSTRYFILIQHADSDPEFQSSMLPTLKELSQQGQVSLKDYAYLYDRVKRNTGGLQLYGTQLSYGKDGNLFDSSNRIIYPQDLADPANVDTRRKEVGLGPIEKYYEQVLEALGRPRRR
jgi:hypothetical protein